MRAVAASTPSPTLDRYGMRDVVEEYLAALRVAGRSPRTIAVSGAPDVRAVAASTPSPTLDGYGMRDVVEEYLAALRVAGRSPRTIDWYRANLAEFMRFLERDGRAATVADLQPVGVRRWLLALNARPTALAPSSIAGRVRTIKAFGTWVAAELDLPANPVRGVPVPRVPDQLVPSLRDHEIARLVQAATESRQPQRDLALVLLMIDTGMGAGLSNAG